MLGGLRIFVTRPHQETLEFGGKENNSCGNGGIMHICNQI